MVEGMDEKRIFEILGVPWREPTEQVCLVVEPLDNTTLTAIALRVCLEEYKRQKGKER